ncbi:calmodulin-like [Ixodes scapularis]|uniref:calmodulin-like n=1 Tax=Ixodes scapularis TaxID=6945 RepID=UPI001A9DBBFC|nr:calmodulin-like [Ixodes scapularis]
MEASAEIRQVFALLDRDCDLELSFEELKTALRAMGLAVTEAQCDALQRDLENDTGKSSVDYMGFLSVLAKMEHQNLFGPESDDVRDSTKRALQLLDLQDNGLVSVLDIRWLLTTIGEPLSAAEADKFLQDVGAPDAHGRVPYQKLVDVLLSDP